MGPGKRESLFMRDERDRISSNMKQSLSSMKQEMLDLSQKQISKDAKYSETLREQANRIFSKKSHSSQEHVRIWELYSKSVAVAPSSSKELSSALYNRSSLSYHLHKYAECIQDLIYAEKCNPSDILKMKIAYRKAECSAKLESASINDVVKTAIKEIENLSVNETIKSETIVKLKKIDAGTSTIRKNAAINDDSGDFEIDFQKEIPCASTAVTLKYTEEFGRHVVATRCIKPGEILAIEKMYPLLDETGLYTHCSNCSRVVWASIPCGSCGFAVYCSEECKNDAWSAYHDIECCITGLLDFKTELGEVERQSTRLMIRALKQSDGSISVLKKKLDKIDNCSDYRNRGFSEDGIFRSESCESYLSLITNADTKTVAELNAISEKISRIVFYLAAFTEIFGKKYCVDDLSKIPEQEDALFIGSLISRLFHAAIVNRFNLGEQVDITPRRAWSNEMDNKEVPHEHKDIGTAVVPFCSFINHACLLNIATCMTEDGRLVIFAVLPIEKGSQIFKRYRNSIACDECPKDTRRKAMRVLYNISDCKCLACVNDFPTTRQAPEVFRITKDKKVLELITKIYQQNRSLSLGVKKNAEMMMNCLEMMVKKSLYQCKEFYMLIDELIYLFYVMHDRWFQIPSGCKK